MSTTDFRLQRLLEKLDDDLDFMVSLQSISRTLDDALIHAQDEFIQSFTEFRPEARKYWTVLQDHLHERHGHLIGLFFVLAQTALTQTISILKAVRAQSHLPLSLPTDRSGMLKTHVRVDAYTNLSIFIIVDTAANYYKHHAEWPDDWTPATKSQLYTIERAKECGMRPGWFTDNLQRAFDLLDRNPAGM